MFSFRSIANGLVLIWMGRMSAAEPEPEPEAIFSEGVPPVPLPRPALDPASMSGFGLLKPVPKSLWQPDEDCKRCPGTGCSNPVFSLTHRRHHCRGRRIQAVQSCEVARVMDSLTFTSAFAIRLWFSLLWQLLPRDSDSLLWALPEISGCWV
jgi:hypothetical protein